MRLRTEGIAWQELDGELVVLDLASSTYLAVNPSGTMLATLLQEERTLEELRDALVAEYRIPADVAEADARAYVDDLRARGLLR
jgi:Coenzyme PQQ synthesis protein D (PqqD)